MFLIERDLFHGEKKQQQKTTTKKHNHEPLITPHLSVVPSNQAMPRENKQQ